MSLDIVVLGAGVIGLAAGIRLLQACPGVSVTVIADKTASDTTSQGSGGLWLPYSLGVQESSRCSFLSQWTAESTQTSTTAGDTPSSLVYQWGQETFEHLLGLFHNEGSAAGSQLVSGYHVWQV